MHSEVLSPEMVSRFNGLMRHLKSNSDWDEQQKQVMVSNVEALVPEDCEDMLQSEFERRCSFGDRMNTELMSSAKWVKLLRECGALVSFDADGRGGLGAISLAEADMIFLKVLHDCDYGGKRLTYDLFCKALYLVSRAARPDLSGEAAFSELLARIAAVAPEDPSRMSPAPDLMLDPSVINVLDNFKPALYDVFHTFCNRNLENPAHATPGSGSVRLSERTYWKHTQDSMGLSSMGSFGRSTMYASGGRDLSLNGGLERSASTDAIKAGSSSPGSRARLVGDEDAANGMADGDGAVPASAVSPSQSPRSAAARGNQTGPPEAGEKYDRDAGHQEAESGSAVRHRSHSPASAQNAEADAGGGYAENSRRPLSPSLLQGDSVEPIFEDSIPASMGGPLMQMSSAMGGGLVSGSTMLTASGTMYSGSTSMSQDPYQYANGRPVIKNRRRHMSFDQMFALCKDLKIVPDLISRLEVCKIFKRAQTSRSSYSNHGSSLYGYLSAEGFMDAAGQLALEAYSKQPFSEEYPEPSEKIQAFFLSVLPGSSREVHERFLYGCSGRGR